MAQFADDESDTRDRRWTFSASFGFATKGPAREIENFLRAGGFDQNDGKPVSRETGRDHPYSLTGLDFQAETPWSVSSFYSFKPPFALGAIVANTTIGTTWGFQSPLYLDIRYSVMSFSPVLAINAWDFIRVGAGPAFYHPKTRTDSFGSMDKSKINNKTGFLIDFGVILPKKSTLFAELSLQYRNVGGVTIGPFQSETLAFTSTLLPIEVSFNHWFFGIGLGIRT